MGCMGSKDVIIKGGKKRERLYPKQEKTQLSGSGRFLSNFEIECIESSYKENGFLVIVEIPRENDKEATPKNNFVNVKTVKAAPSSKE